MTMTIANQPKTMKLVFSDHKAVEISVNMINECEALKEDTGDYRGIEALFVPVKCAGFTNAFKFLKFYDNTDPDTNFDAFLKATKRAVKFVHGLSDRDKSQMVYTIDFLQCKRLVDCMQMYIKVVNNNYEIEAFGKLPRFVKKFTLDHKTIRIPREIIRESEVLIILFKAFGNISSKQRIALSSVSYHKALKALNLCDLDTPHVPLTMPPPDAPMTPELSEFAEENQPVMDYFKTLMNLDLYEINKVASFLSIRRLCDLINVYIITLDEDRRERVLRGQVAINEYFRHMEDIQQEDEDDNQYVLPAEGVGGMRIASLADTDHSSVAINGQLDRTRASWPTRATSLTPAKPPRPSPRPLTPL
uniref:SKP1-like protein 21 n=1 Tax=Panagrellus redivivus TaxID=6233 RepID=A0A7E4VIX7_PANRE